MDLEEKCPCDIDGQCCNSWGCLGYKSCTLEDKSENLVDEDLDYLRKLGKWFRDK